MYKIEQTQIGFKLTFGGTITKEELEPWFEESKKALNTCKKPFGVIVDMRNVGLLPPDVQAEIVKGQMLYRNGGLQRSAVILGNARVTIQFMRLAKKSGIYNYERFIDASSDAQWESMRKSGWASESIPTEDRLLFAGILLTRQTRPRPIAFLRGRISAPASRFIPNPVNCDQP